jgi:hypothetical protein
MIWQEREMGDIVDARLRWGRDLRIVIIRRPMTC